PCAPSSLATSLPLVRRLPPGQARLRRRAVAHRFPWVQRLPSCLAVRLPWRGGRAVECGGLENRFGRFRPTRVQIPPPPLLNYRHALVLTRCATGCRRSRASPGGSRSAKRNSAAARRGLTGETRFPPCISPSAFT